MPSTGAAASICGTVTEKRRATSDQLLDDLERLRELEIQKRQVTPGSEEFVGLAKAVEDLAHRVLGSSIEQLQLAAEAARALERGGEPEPPIAAAPARDMQDILSDWREAERARAAAAGTPNEAGEEARVRRFRDEYQQSFANRRSGEG